MKNKKATYCDKCKEPVFFVLHCSNGRVRQLNKTGNCPYYQSKPSFFEKLERR